MENTTSIIFQNPEPPSSLDALWIEEKGWEIDPNRLSFAEFWGVTEPYIYYNASTAEGWLDRQLVTPPTHNCGIVNGKITNTIYVYRYNNSLGYSLRHSYGNLATLSSCKSESVPFEEVFNFSINKTAKLSYPMSGSLNMSWQGTVYDEQGNVISPPSYILQDGNIVLSQKVYGSLKVKYTLYRDTYDLSVSPNDNDNDLFGGAVYAVFSSGISWLELDSPPEITPELLEGDISCGWQWEQLYFIWPPYPERDTIPKYAPKVDTTVTTDYCTQLVTSVTKDYT